MSRPETTEPALNKRVPGRPDEGSWKRWFDFGVDAIAHVLGERPEGYVCPLCLQVCTSLAEVSLEDAPPRSVGGCPVALTCVPCNSGAGHRLEGELRKAEDLLDSCDDDPRPAR